MQDNSNVNKQSLESLRQRILKRIERKSYSSESFDKKLQPLITKAAGGDFQSLIRLEAISKLLDPCLDFYESDVQRILNKGYPIQVERGLKLYRMMHRLQILLEPVGTRTGVACGVRLINFERLSYGGLQDIRGTSFYLMQSAAFKFQHGDKFNGLDLLKPEERDIYHKVKKYFGGRKRPTLKSLAIGLLGEVEEVYSERNAANYLAAVKDFQNRHRKQLGVSWYFIWTVDSFGSDRETGHELAVRLNKLVNEAFRAQAQKVLVEVARMQEQLAQQTLAALIKEQFKAQLAAVAEIRNHVAQAARLREWIQEERARLADQTALFAKVREQAAQIAAINMQTANRAVERELIRAAEGLYRSTDIRQELAKVGASLLSSFPRIKLPRLNEHLKDVYGRLELGKNQN
jgi:hypothetical protein